MRAPLSPPFHVNLRWGLRYFHLAAILPLHRVDLDPQAVRVDFAPAPPVKKQGKKATPEQWAEYKQAKKKLNLSAVAIQRIEHLRTHLDATDQREGRVLIVGDGSYTNRSMLENLPQGVEYLGWTRGDIALCLPAPTGGRKVYGERFPTPDKIRQDPAHPWTQTNLFFAGAMRNARFKALNNVLWQTEGGRKPLRLLIVAPTPYRAPGRSRRRLYYRDPAYVLTTDLHTPAQELIQAYLARWQIEVEHRDLKTGLGVGQAQV